MVAAEAEPGVQASRAASFWDKFYCAAPAGALLQQPQPRPADCAAGESSITGTAASGICSASHAAVDTEDGLEEATENHCEWIIEPEAALPGILSVLRGREPASVLELGCGESALAELLHDALGGCAAVTAVDISQVALASAEARSKATADRPQLRFALADATDLRGLFEDCSLDLVIDKGMSDTLQFRARTKESQALRTRLFAEVFRVLAPGGLYLVLTPKPRVRFLRAAGSWEAAHRKVLSTPGEAMLVRGRPDSLVYLHTFVKASTAVPVPTPSPRSRSAEAGAAAADEGEGPSADTCCDRCGVARRPRYRSDRSWTRHRDWCVAGVSA